MKYLPLFLVVVLLLSGACQSGSILGRRMDKDNTETLRVKGRSGQAADQELRIGDYRFTKPAREWNLPLRDNIDRFRGLDRAKGKLQYGLRGPFKLQATLFTAVEPEPEDRRILKDIMNFELRSRGIFFGAFLAEENQAHAWFFQMPDPKTREEERGLLSDGDTEISIRRLASGKRGDVYEFVWRNRLAGGLEINDKPQVFLSQDLPRDIRYAMVLLGAAIVHRLDS